MKAWLLLIGLAGAAAAEPVRDVVRGYSFDLPAGYREYPEGRTPNIPFAYVRGKMLDPGFGVLQIQTLGGTIGREPIDRNIAQAAARKSAAGVSLTGFDWRTVKWRGFDLELMVTHAKGGDQSLVIYGVQIPLAKEAIQILLMGGSEADISGDLEALLASVDGKSSWLTTEERSERLGRGVGILVGIMIVVAIALVIRRRSRA